MSHVDTRYAIPRSDVDAGRFASTGLAGDINGPYAGVVTKVRDAGAAMPPLELALKTLEKSIACAAMELGALREMLKPVLDDRPRPEGQQHPFDTTHEPPAASPLLSALASLNSQVQALSRQAAALGRDVQL